MKVVTLLLSLLLSISPSFAQKAQSDNHKGRFEKIINSQWTFNYFSAEAGDKGFEAPGYDDSRWPAISLPHTWNSYETTGEIRPFTRSPGETGETYWWTGWGWYRKHFSINSDYADFKVFIEFEGVQKYCKVWINGKYAGDHKGGYGSFDFDITGYLKAGADNVIAVAVSNLQKDEFKLHSLTEGSYNISCGIYRDVRIVLKNKLYIPMQGSGSHEGGTFISTPTISDKEAVVNVKTWVKNDYSQPKTCILQTSISDKNNQVIQVVKTEAVINPDQLYMFDQTTKPIKNPRLWSPGDPNMYTVYSEIIDKKDVVDSYTGSMGFRWFRVDEKDHSFYLNNRKIALSGVNRRQEYPWLGDAIPDWMTEMDYSTLSHKKENNFMSTVNNPGNRDAFDQSDIHGFIAREGFTALILHMFTPDEQKLQIREMIRRDRNHPSLVAWVVGDEPGKPANSIYASSEDSTRRINSFIASIDTSATFFGSGDKKPPDDSPAAAKNEPAGIVLASSHDRMSSDRGSVAVIVAEIVDSKGNKLYGTKKTLSWKVTGPARLTGPCYYVSYADSNRRSDEGLYISMPATNLIRSTGIPGKIKVTVFSSGLSSGSVELEAVEIISGNSVINEPGLSDVGRKPVVRTALITQRLDEIPVEISPVSQDFNIPQTDQKGYGRILGDFIKKNNPSVDTTSFELRTLIALFVNQLNNNSGKISSADYNFNAGHYNTCRLISTYISRTKLPALFKESLKQYYSNLLITDGIEKNAGEEMNWLNWIPSGGVVIIVQDQNVISGHKDCVILKQSGLTEIIKTVYPQFAKFSDDAKQRALIYISRMNPSVRVSYPEGNVMSAGSEIGPAATFIADKGKPILIPEFKFINE